jgi:hypothetical protein
MALISYQQFGRLQLQDFLLREPELQEGVRVLEDWEFMGGLWTGEAIGFTEFLRHSARPGELGCVSLHVSDLPETVSNAMLKALGLPLERGMSSQAVQAAIGEPENVQSFAADRLTYEYSLGGSHSYYVSCTVDEGDGLTYVVVIRKDILVLCETDA